MSTAAERRQAARQHAEQMLRIIDRGTQQPNPAEAKAHELIMLADLADSLGAIAEVLDTGNLWIRSGDVV